MHQFAVSDSFVYNDMLQNMHHFAISDSFVWHLSRYSMFFNEQM
jgi:hypothetical protein